VTVVFRRNLSLQAYLLGLIVLATVVVGGFTAFQQHLRLERARASTVDTLDLVAGLAANDLATAVKSTQDSVANVAANPGLLPLFDTPTPSGCSLTFIGVGAFKTGHIDVIDRHGKVLCSSAPLPGVNKYAGASWLTSTKPTLTTVDDSGHQSLLVLSPIKDHGVVATFLKLADMPSDLSDQYGSTMPLRFALQLSDGVSVGRRAQQPSISRGVSVPSLDWTVSSSVDEATALGDARNVNRQVTIFLLVALLVLLGATHLIYLGIARPIRRLSSSVRHRMAGDPMVDPPKTGPAEVVSLARDFATLNEHVAHELARREDAEREAKASEHSYRTLFEANPQPMWVHHSETGQVLNVNDAMVTRFGWSREELLAMRYDELLADHSQLQDALGGDTLIVRSGPWELCDRDGEQVECVITSDALSLRGTPGRIVIAEDVTIQQRAERLLQRSDRMESLGQLAGGIAHDFNNVLAVMLNYADFAIEELLLAADEQPQRWEPVLHDVQEIGTAGRRAAALTRQLLSFARGDALETGMVNLNDVASNVEQLLRRTLGEQISLELVLEADPWTLEANAAQLEQMIVNLAVNARDAMPKGGRLSIETVNVLVDDEYASSRPERRPGRYVRLRVSDTGHGMDAEARDHAFEPFFTTKDRATGTGLGLAIVYGAVTRAGGTVDIYSEPGHGTSVSIYLPVCEDQASSEPTVVPAPARSTGSETILLVEDDDALRPMAERILTRDGYRVLTAPDGPAAEQVAAAHRGEIDLLLTDIVMPGMLGSELAVRIRELDPQVRVLFMSGYAPGMLLHAGTLPPDAALVDKPFSADLLLGIVRRVLDTGTGAGVGVGVAR
jgi:PAS domain S-box-containing protein